MHPRKTSKGAPALVSPFVSRRGCVNFLRGRWKRLRSAVQGLRSMGREAPGGSETEATYQERAEALRGLVEIRNSTPRCEASFRRMKVLIYGLMVAVKGWEDRGNARRWAGWESMHAVQGGHTVLHAALTEGSDRSSLFRHENARVSPGFESLSVPRFGSRSQAVELPHCSETVGLPCFSRDDDVVKHLHSEKLSTAQKPFCNVPILLAWIQT